MADEEKTEQATPKKLSKARSEGQTAKSVEVSSTFLLLAGVTSVYIFCYLFYQGFLGIMRQCFIFSEIPDFDRVYCLYLLNKYARKYILIVAPVMSILFLAALVVNIAQVGFLLSSKALEPKLSNLNPISGFKKLFSMKSFVELFKNIAKIAIIGLVLYFAVRGDMDNLQKLYDSNVAYILLYILKMSFKLFMYVILIMIFVAILDYSFQKWKFKKDLMMSKQEVKDETKMTEGDPLVKSKIRSLQIQAARRRMMQEVPEADVVVTNPVHLALAIKYEPSTMNAPQVTAKGAGSVAEKIKEIAKEHNIPVVENKELAQNLYKLVDIGEEIPLQFFKAVAELLAYVYKLKGKTV